MTHVGEQKENSKLTQPKLCKTVFLNDVPSSDDRLAPPGTTGPHARVAKALGNAIRSGEFYGKMVGIEGGWGSGKTTVINLLQKELEPEQKKIKFFCFDAWAHEGDPLRRTYLESLIGRLREWGWVDNRKWSDRLLELSHRRKISDTKTIPIMTGWGVALTISAFMVPFGIALFSSGAEKLVVGFGLAPNWKAIIGAPLGVLPLLLGLAAVVRHKWQNRKKADGAKGVSLGYALFFKGEITETKQETTEAPEPTSIEFETRFEELMREALSNGDRSLVIVLDNLDRVNVKDALSIWATLQTFLQHRATQWLPWFNRVCILVPYDPAGLRRLWDASPAPVGDAPSADKISADVAFKPSDVAESFVDKSFQIRFEVPPLLLSNWKAYLLNLLRQSLPEHPESDLQLIYRVFASVQIGAAPTPRELVLYVNQIAAIHLQWQDSFSISHVAYFASLQRIRQTNPGDRW